MDVKKLQDYFSIPVFLIVLFVGTAAILLFKQSAWLLLATLLLALLLSFLYRYWQDYHKKDRYVSTLEKRAESTFNVILENIRKMLIKPEEVESVHKLRVSIRRFRSIISLAKPQMSEKSYLRIQDFFRQRGRELADLREMDVLIDTIENIPELENSQLLERFRAMRLAEQEEAVKLLDEKYVANLKKHYNEFLDEVRGQDMREFDRTFDDRIKNWDQYIIKRLPQVNELPWSKVHRVRIKSKKARYISEIFNEDIDETYGSRTKEYKRIQSDLGERCDQLRNLEAIDEWIESDNPQIIREKEIFKAITVDGEIPEELRKELHEEQAEALLEELDEVLETPAGDAAEVKLDGESVEPEKSVEAEKEEI